MLHDINILGVGRLQVNSPRHFVWKGEYLFVQQKGVTASDPHVRRQIYDHRASLHLRRAQGGGARKREFRGKEYGGEVQRWRRLLRLITGGRESSPPINTTAGQHLD
ncbi:uncharacterized protein LOC135169588 [Diachasmimorpha longicaudata]|uniref:uncharacterized protein LOC135169588 n=1 Tax=Diachasmimorpha longicaudata TaxID=58733 RepID=UPI0030B8C7F4